MSEIERIELYSNINRIKDDLISVRWDLKAQASTLKQIEERLKELENVK